MLAGVVIGIALSLVWLVYVTTTPGMPLLGREPGTHVFRDVLENPGDETFPGYAVVRLDGGLFFATADALEERVRDARRRTPTRRCARWCWTWRAWTSSTPRAPRSSRRSSTSPTSAGVRLQPRPRQARRGQRARTSDGVLERLGGDRVHGNVHRAVEAQLAAERGHSRMS